MKPKNLNLSLLAASMVPFILGGCALPSFFRQEEDLTAYEEDPFADPVEETADVTEASGTDDVVAEADDTLYGWDGKPVADSDAVVGGPGFPAHVIEPSVSGRMHIIELYQAVLDERDALSQELATLTASLERTRADLDSALLRETDAEARASGFEQRASDLSGAVEDLTGRLVTAQIRRLEAERILLESKIEWQRALNGAGAGQQPAQPAPAAQPATPAVGVGQ